MPVSVNCSAEAKLAVALGIVALTVAAPLPAWEFFVTATLGVLAVARVPWRQFLRRLAWLGPLLLAAAWWPAGGIVAARIAVKSALCVLTLSALTATTPFTELLRVLRRLRVPVLLVTTLALLYRYLSVLVEETQRMQRARAARTFTAPRGWRLPAGLVGRLFVRSTERAERIYAAMCARGWR